MEAILYSKDTGQPMVRLRDPRALEAWTELCIMDRVLVTWSAPRDTPCGVTWMCPIEWVPLKWSAKGFLQ